MEILSPGERILLYRHRAGMTKKELAERAGVSVATIKKYEDDLVEFDSDTLLAIASALSTTSNKIKFGFYQPDEGADIKTLLKNE